MSHNHKESSYHRFCFTLVFTMALTKITRFFFLEVFNVSVNVFRRLSVFSQFLLSQMMVSWRKLIFCAVFSEISLNPVSFAQNLAGFVRRLRLDDGVFYEFLESLLLSSLASFLISPFLISFSCFSCLFSCYLLFNTGLALFLMMMMEMMDCYLDFKKRWRVSSVLVSVVFLVEFHVGCWDLGFLVDVR